jgi:predicted RNA binding protein YcfA (HicA-like mRNA interferase family)
MSPRLPNLRPREAVNAFVKNGFSIVGQKGSHIRLTNSAGVQFNHPTALN